MLANFFVPILDDGWRFIAIFAVVTFLAALTGLAWLFWPLMVLTLWSIYFFRDPPRRIPQTSHVIVSPADGKVTDLSVVTSAGIPRNRISIFLNVFNVHVNRSPIAGVIRDVRYQRGKFLNAMAANSAEENEQNIVTVEGEGHTVVFKQIAGLIARRIIFTRKVGDTVARGERIGLIKFGSRVDVLLDRNVSLQIKIGDRVMGGESVLALLPVATAAEPILAGERRTH